MFPELSLTGYEIELARDLAFTEGDSSTLLDVASDSDRTTLRGARLAGCIVHGIDIHPQPVAAANVAAREAGLVGRTAAPAERSP